MSAAPRPPLAEVLDGWQRLGYRWSALLHHAKPDADWLGEVRAGAVTLRALAAQDPDVALYVLLDETAEHVERYSVHHAMCCAVVAELAAAALGWEEGDTASLVHAALTMNLSITSIQDTLAAQAAAPTAAQRERIAAHGADSARLLAEAGLDDATWLAVVRDHHQPAGDADPLAGEPAQRQAQLLRRIDVYLAKLSRRAVRRAVTPALAARDACLGAGGQPDAIGATLLRVMGLYPPGTYVQLNGGEMGIVVRRGEKAHTPLVAVLRRGDGATLAQPQRRDSALQPHAVLRGLHPDDVRVRLKHERVLGC